jgi:hypothetical protein
MDVDREVKGSKEVIIEGVPGIIKHHILNNRRHVLIEDDHHNVQLWDIARVTKFISINYLTFFLLKVYKNTRLWNCSF